MSKFTIQKKENKLYFYLLDDLLTVCDGGLTFLLFISFSDFNSDIEFYLLINIIIAYIFIFIFIRFIYLN